ncbi:MAG: amidohydrolase family protein [Microvirga sp.]
MNGKIAVEEHFAVEDTLQESSRVLPAKYWNELSGRLLDIHDNRLQLMDAHGVQMMLLSLNAPTVQAVAELGQAIEMARRANDWLAEKIVKTPDRFQGLAAIPMQDPDAAIRELERSIKELGFVGVLVNGFSETNKRSEAIYYDLDRYRPFWAACAELDVPFYLHPRNPLWLLGATWAFGQETAVHALRLMACGIFDQYPGLKIVLGHMGEGLPFNIWRADNRTGWVKEPPSYPAKKKFGDYLQSNFWLSTSGNFCTQVLLAAILQVGADRLLFSIDWPFENIDHGSEWFDKTPISENDRIKIGRTNAQELFKLKLS